MARETAFFPMAFHKHFKLPPLRLTQRCGTDVQVRCVHRGVAVCSQRSPGPEPVEEASSQETQDNLDMDSGANLPLNQESGLSPNEPTDHQLHSQASVRGWEKLRMSMLLSAVESSAMPVDQTCLLCSKLAVFRCQECGPLIYYCYECFSKQHEKVNFFHIAEKWEVDHYERFDFEQRLVNIRPLHVCDTLKESPIQCIDDLGMESSIRIVCCDCEPLAMTLVRAQLWPASPSYPRYAFSFKLLDWAESLLLECQVALKDFCQALYFRCPYTTITRRDIYSCLIDAFEEYRFFRHEMRHLSFLSESLDPGNVCPACPRDSGKVVYALDALFGLPRKRSAGFSYRESLHGSLYFLEQSSIDEFVSKRPHSKQVVQECNDFLAGNMLRSSTRFKALDETGVFGAACRHEFPALFFNLKHGERLAYSVLMINKLIERLPHNTMHMYVMYDIACTLRKHLERSEDSHILERIHLCLPSFHSFGHKASCQIVFGPLRCGGIGLSDGETMERLWSYLRRFGRMTKEMRPSHRTDVLVHALLHYGMKTKAKLGNLLVSRWRRTEDIYKASIETFHKLTESYDCEIVTESTVQAWITEESMLAKEGDKGRGILRNWRYEYVLLLQSYLNLQDKLTQIGLKQQQKLTVCREVSKLNTRLCEMEKQYCIPHRWAPTDHEYTQVQQVFSREKQSQLAEAMWASSARRQFLLKLKAKYAEGQKIAKKLSVQVSKETRTLKALLEEYNACQTIATDGSSTLSLLDVLDPSTLAQILNPKLSVYKPGRQQIISAYIMLTRSHEEMEMLQSEMRNVVHYYETRVSAIKTIMDEPSRLETKYIRGAHALLHNMLIDTTVQLAKCKQLFAMCLNAPASVYSEDSSDSSNHDSDLDI